MIVHFVPDGKSKSMSNLGTEVAADKLAGKSGKTAAKAEIVPAGEDGQMSKKQLAKLAKKANKGAAKDGAKPDDANA